MKRLSDLEFINGDGEVVTIPGGELVKCIHLDSEMSFVRADSILLNDDDEEGLLSKLDRVLGRTVNEIRFQYEE